MREFPEVGADDTEPRAVLEDVLDYIFPDT